jgi:hypothetical protein
MDAAAARCLAMAGSIAARMSAGVWASNPTAAEMTAKATRMCTVPIIISLESEAFPADVIGEGRKAIG